MIAPRLCSLDRCRLALWLVLVTACGFIQAGCDRVALTAPTESTIVVFADRTVVPINGTAEITATVFEQAGTPVQNGTQVTFTTTLGRLDPAEARTKDGKATVRLIAGTQSGTANVAAFSGPTRSEDVQILIGGAAATRVLLTATPTSVPPAGGTVGLVAVVLDENGNRLPGVPVTFTTSAGTLALGTVTSDANGEARTQLTTTVQAVVNATAGPATSDAVTVTVTALPAPLVVTLTASPNPATVNNPVTFTVSHTPGEVGVASYEYQFGDGPPLTINSPSTTHVYATPGTRNVSVTVVAVDGRRATTQTQVVVR